MRILLATALALIAVPGARAAGVTMAVRDVPLHGGRSLAAARPAARFDMVGLHWQGPGRVLFSVRTRRGWTGWQAADDDSGPTRGSAEARAQRGWRDGGLVWTGRADAIRYRTAGRVTRLRAYLLWSPPVRIAPRTLQVAGAPPILTRAAWGADESIVREAPAYAPAIRFAVVHHTVNANDYTPADAVAMVRGIERYHVLGNGWNDIGYNFLIDRFGRVYEGRAGGIDRPVIGAHAGGFNTGSVGVALIGTFTSAQPTAEARAALVSLLAWKLDVAHVDPLSTLSVATGGNERYRPGTQVTLRAVSGHRDTGLTECPGTALYAELPAIAQDVAATGSPKVYAPAVAGAAGGQVRFTARLSAPGPWTVTVADAAGAKVASGSGSGQNVDWTWDATSAPPSALYRWTIAGAPQALPATGTLGRPSPAPSPAPKPAPPPAPPPTVTPTPTPAPLIGPVVVAPGVVSPDGDGQADVATVTYALGQDAKVTATVSDPSGAVVQALFTAADRPAGPQSFRWSPATLPDGSYTLTLVAVAADGTQLSAATGVLVDRTLSALRLAPAVISPNGDGRADALGVSFSLAAPAQVTLQVLRGSTVVATPFQASLEAGVQQLGWDGTTVSGPVPDGPYTLVVTATDALTTVALSAPFAVDTHAPALELLSAKRLLFRLDEPATVTLSVNGARIVKVEPAGVFHVPFTGGVRTVRAVAWDAAGNGARASAAAVRRGTPQ